MKGLGKDREEDPEHLGGMADVTESMRKVPGHRGIGPMIGELFRELINTVPGAKELLFDATGQKDYDKEQLDDWAFKGRTILATALNCKDLS